MKRWLCMLTVLALLLTLAAPGAAAAAPEEFHGYLVTTPELRVQSVTAVDADMTYVRDNLYYVESLADVEAMRQAGLVEYCEPNYPMQLMDIEWNMDRVHADTAWDHVDAEDNYDRRGTGITIAVIDSGVKADNADFLADHILPYKDYYNNPNGVDIWHGTFVTGLIAAQVNNNFGIDGAACDVNILPICITKDGKSDVLTAIDAIDYAVEHGADVINFSIGGTKSTRALQAACNDAVEAGVILVAAAGNYEEGTTDTSEKHFVYPAGYDNVISVSGVKKTDNGLEFDSTYSYYNNKVNVCAPGTNVKSLYMSLGTAQASGTSFAAPIVSAMAAIAKQANPNIGQDTFTTLVTSTATDLGAEGYDIYYGSGLVNFAAFCDALEAEYPIHYYSGSEEARFDGDYVRSYTVCDPDIPLPEPVRPGYRFLGWYSSPTLMGKPVTAIPSASIGERSFYASWRKTANTAPAISDRAPESAGAAPASRDGKTPAAGFTADIGEWFLDPDGDSLTYEIVEGPGTLAGSSYTFLPEAADAGHSFNVQFRATDAKGALSPVHTLRILVSAVPNSAPAIAAGAPDTAQAVPASRDGKTPAAGFTADIGEWFVDPDGDSLTYEIVEGPGTLAGSTYTFLPEAADAGQALTLRVRAADSTSAESPAHALHIEVGSIPNSAPAVSGSAPAQVSTVPASADGTVAAQPFSADLDEWFLDPDGDSLTYRLIEGPGQLSGSTYTFVPTAQDIGRDYAVRIEASDGTAVSPAVSLTVHVTDSPNSAPIVSADAPAAAQAVPASRDGKIPAAGFTADVGEWFLDPDGDSLSYEIVEGPGVLSGSTLTYIPDADSAGKAVIFRLKAADALSESPVHTLTVTVGAVPNSAPAIAAGAPDTAQAVPASRDGKIPAAGFTADVGEWFLDPDGDSLTYEIVEGPGTLIGSSYTFLPEAADADSIVALLLQAEDAAGSRSPVLTLRIAVGAVPESPAGPQVLAPVTLNLCELPSEVRYALEPRGDTLVGVSLNGEALQWSLSDGTLAVSLPAALSEGTAELVLRFDSGETLTAQWLVERHCPSAAFKDVPLNIWYHSYVDFAVRRGLMQGVGADRFEPDSVFTRAMLVTVLYRMAGQPAASVPSPFGDVPADTWYSVPVAWAAEHGIVNGTAPGTFAPNDPVTREQLVTILFRYAGDDGARAGLDAFPDADAVSSYARDAMDWAIAHGIVSGIASRTGTTLSPRDSATRAQVAAILMRFDAIE